MVCVSLPCQILTFFTHPLRRQQRACSCPVEDVHSAVVSTADSPFCLYTAKVRGSFAPSLSQNLREPLDAYGFAITVTSMPNSVVLDSQRDELWNYVMRFRPI